RYFIIDGNQLRAVAGAENTYIIPSGLKELREFLNLTIKDIYQAESEEQKKEREAKLANIILSAEAITDKFVVIEKARLRDWRCLRKNCRERREGEKYALRILSYDNIVEANPAEIESSRKEAEEERKKAYRRHHPKAVIIEEIDNFIAKDINSLTDSREIEVKEAEIHTSLREYAADRLDRLRRRQNVDTDELEIANYVD
ncbi:4324_t:CDS:2, partial [Entrophospora sp. SA101]